MEVPRYRCWAPLVDRLYGGDQHQGDYVRGSSPVSRDEPTALYSPSFTLWDATVKSGRLVGWAVGICEAGCIAFWTEGASRIRPAFGSNLGRVA